MPVGEIAERLDLDSSTVSHALSSLKRAGLVRSLQDRYTKRYSLTDRVRVTTDADGRLHIEASFENGIKINISL